MFLFTQIYERDSRGTYRVLNRVRAEARPCPPRATDSTWDVS